MKNSFEEKLLKAMKKFKGKKVKVRLCGIVQSKFEIEGLNYTLKDEILAIRDGYENYIDIDIDDIEKLYFDSVENKYAILVLVLEERLEIEIQTVGHNASPIIQKIRNEIDKARIFDEILKKEGCRV